MPALVSQRLAGLQRKGDALLRLLFSAKTQKGLALQVK
jgi:hypothetical protein